MGALAGYATYKLCRDTSTRREQFREFGSASRWSGGVLALLVFLIFRIARIYIGGIQDALKM